MRKPFTSTPIQFHYVCLLGCLLASTAFSQTINELADNQLQRQQQREEARRRQDEATPDVRLDAPTLSKPDVYNEDEKPCFVIRHVELDGDEAERFRWALTTAAPRLGRCLGSTGINTLVGAIQSRTYRELDLTINERGLLAQERSLAEAAGWKRPDGTIWWPPYDGALPGTTKIIDLNPGSGAPNLVDRFGRTSGSYVSPAGLSLESRALSSTPTSAPSVYSIDGTITGVERATIAPWFGQKGLGVQYKFPDTVQFYLDKLLLGGRK